MPPPEFSTIHINLHIKSRLDIVGDGQSAGIAEYDNMFNFVYGMATEGHC